MILYEEYKKAKESGVSNKERYKLLANFIYKSCRCRQLFKFTKSKKGPKSKKEIDFVCFKPNF